MVTQAEIGNRLRARRKALQYSQEKLASLVDADQTAISRWELGGSITVAQLQTLADALKTTVAELCEPGPASSDSGTHNATDPDTPAEPQSAAGAQS